MDTGNTEQEQSVDPQGRNQALVSGDWVVNSDKGKAHLLQQGYNGMYLYCRAQSVEDHPIFGKSSNYVDTHGLSRADAGRPRCKVCARAAERIYR